MIEYGHAADGSLVLILDPGGCLSADREQRKLSGASTSRLKYGRAQKSILQLLLNVRV